MDLVKVHMLLGLRYSLARVESPPCHDQLAMHLPGVEEAMKSILGVFSGLLLASNLKKENKSLFSPS
jgi:hypothetical protein